MPTTRCRRCWENRALHEAGQIVRPCPGYEPSLPGAVTCQSCQRQFINSGLWNHAERRYAAPPLCAEHDPESWSAYENVGQPLPTPPEPPPPDRRTTVGSLTMNVAVDLSDAVRHLEAFGESIRAVGVTVGEQVAALRTLHNERAVPVQPVAAPGFEVARLRSLVELETRVCLRCGLQLVAHCVDGVCPTVPISQHASWVPSLPGAAHCPACVGVTQRMQPGGDGSHCCPMHTPVEGLVWVDDGGSRRQVSVAEHARTPHTTSQTPDQRCLRCGLLFAEHIGPSRTCAVHDYHAGVVTWAWMPSLPGARDCVRCQHAHASRGAWDNVSGCYEREVVCAPHMAHVESRVGRQSPARGITLPREPE